MWQNRSFVALGSHALYMYLMLIFILGEKSNFHLKRSKSMLVEPATIKPDTKKIWKPSKFGPLDGFISVFLNYTNYLM